MTQRAFRDDNLCHGSETDSGSWAGFWVFLFIVATVLAFVFFSAARATSRKLASESDALAFAQHDLKSARIHAVELIAKADDLRVERNEALAERDLAVAVCEELEKQLEASQAAGEKERTEIRDRMIYARTQVRDLEHFIEDLQRKLAECRAELSEATRFGQPVPIEPKPDVAPPVPEKVEPVPKIKPAPPGHCQCGCRKPVCQCQRCKPKRKS